MVTAVVLETLDPLDDNLLVFMEEHPLSEDVPIVVEREAKHIVEGDFFEVQALQKYYMFGLDVGLVLELKESTVSNHIVP